MIEQTVVQLLMQDAPVADIVDDRVYPFKLPDGTSFPALVVSKVTGLGSYTNDGDAGLEEARVQVDCYVDTGAADLIALRNVVRRKLSGFKGGIESGSSCAIDSIFCMNDTDLPVPETVRAGPTLLKRRMLEFRIWNREL